MVIVIDTREQLPYQFPCTTVRAKLDSGDYSLLGYETRVAVERKRPVELFQCFTTDRARFEREYQRLASYERAVLVVEGDIEDCATRKNRWSNVNPKVVIKSLISWYAKYGVAPIFASTREMAEAFTFYVLEKYWLAKRALEKDSSSSCTLGPAPAEEVRP